MVLKSNVTIQEQDVLPLALVMDDPDADGFVHWVAYHIPPDSTGLPADVPGDDLPDGTVSTLTIVPF